MRKWKAIIMISVLVFLTAGTTAYGAGRTVLYNGYERFDSDLDFCAQTEDVSGSGWQWKAANKQLILNGAKLYGMKSGLVLQDDTEIVLVDGTQNTIIRREGLFTDKAIYACGDMTISGNGQLDIYSDGYGIGASDGECVIESGNINIVSFWSGIECPNYVQNGGVVHLNSLDDASKSIDVESLQMNTGELDIESNAGGILTNRLTMNDGIMHIAAIGDGILILEGDCLINNGSISITGNDDYGIFRGVHLYKGSRFIMHDGELEITAIQCDDKASAINFALGGVLGENENNKKIRIDGGKLKLSGSYAMKLEIWNGATPEKRKSNTLLPEELIDIDPKLLAVDGLQVGGLVQSGYNESGKFWESYYYGLIKEGELVSNAVLGVEQEIVQSAGLDGFYVNGRKITLTTANAGSVYIDENGRTIVPLRTITEAMGCTAKWDEADQSITITDGKDVTAVFYLNQKTYWVNGEERQMDTTAVSLPPGRTHVPLRFVAESLGAQVEMSSEADGTAKIMITTGK